jgi:hypothetical protein
MIDTQRRDIIPGDNPILRQPMQAVMEKACSAARIKAERKPARSSCPTLPRLM